ncbi:FGLLP motif-containing membrane protein [Streptomyces populi]
MDDAPTAEAVLEVVEPTRPAPWISLSPDSGQPQEEPTLTGTGFLCDEGAGVDVVWDGVPVTAGTPEASGDFTITFSVPSDAKEGEHKVTARCRAPGEVQASAAFTVNPVPVSNPPKDPREVTIHLTGYPGACAQGAIVIGGRRLDTWLDADSYEGDAGAGHWEFIDLHAPIPGDMTGRRDVELECAATNREKAGEISLPPADQLTYFALPTGTTAHPEKKTGAITPPPTGGHTSGNGGDGSGSSSGGDTSGNGGGGSHSSSGGSTGANGRGTGGTPGNNPAPGLVEALRTPAHVSWALKDLAGSAAMAAWFLMLVLLLERTFPNQLADNAIGRWWRCRRQQRRQRRRPPRQARLPGWARMCGFALLGGSLAVWADVRTGWSPSTAVKTVGAAAGILMVLVSYEKTKESLLRPRGIGFRSELRVVPAGLLLAALMTAMSRFLEFPVPYVYGLIAVYLLLGTPRPGTGQMPKGQAVLIGGICMLATAVLIWVLGAPLVEAVQRGHAPPGSLRYVIAYTLGLAVVAGIEVVVFGLLPLSGMDGHALKHWNKPAWYALYLTGLTFYFHVLLHSLHPGVGTGLAVDGDLRWWTLSIATGLFLAAWAFSLALRWYAARYERQTHS